MQQATSAEFEKMWEATAGSLGRAEDRVWLKPGARQYLWVVQKLKDRWLVSLWNGETYWLRLHGLTIDPDLDGGMPVVRWIGNGCLAQYYRFERPEVLQ